MSIFSKQFEEEIARLNGLLTDSHVTTCALFQLLDSNGIHVGSTELIKAREKVEAEREALKLKVLELSADAARVRCSHKNKEKLYPDEIETLRTANAGLVERVKRLEEAGPIAIQHAFYGRSLSAEQTWKQATKGQP